MIDEAVERNYQVTGITRRGTVIVRDDEGEIRDTGETASEMVGTTAALRDGGTFDYYTREEKKILRRGFRS